MSNVIPIVEAKPKVLEFFAGIGLARKGLESAGFRVAWSNDFESDKKAMYTAHFGEAASAEHDYVLGDVAEVPTATLPSDSRLAWASSPCTDLSLAGGRAGLAGIHSGTFWEFVRILKELGPSRPQVAVLENVIGLATSHGGDDLAAAIRAFNDVGYSVDVVAIDARRFVAQSRPRLFLVGSQHAPVDVPQSNPELRPEWLDWVFNDPTLVTHRTSLPAPPPLQLSGLSAVVEDLPDDDERWWDRTRVESFLGSLSAVQRARLQLMQAGDSPTYRTAYRRTRAGVAVWEVRPDDISGCLRTARGGSSRQALVRLGGSEVDIRWMTALEYARLMGAGDYNLAGIRPNQALFGFGDAVAVPVVSWLATHYLMPLVTGRFWVSGSPVESIERELA